jgi:ribosome-binding protein aMBF1 (putative translation factor)
MPRNLLEFRLLERCSLMRSTSAREVRPRQTRSSTVPLPPERRYREQIGRRLRAPRAWKELSQTEVAEKAGVSRNFVSAIERGAQGLDLFRLRLLADALEIDLVQLIDDHDDWHPYLPPPPPASAHLF